MDINTYLDLMLVFYGTGCLIMLPIVLFVYSKKGDAWLDKHL